MAFRSHLPYTHNVKLSGELRLGLHHDIMYELLSKLSDVRGSAPMIFRLFFQANPVGNMDFSGIKVSQYGPGARGRTNISYSHIAVLF